MNKQSASYCGLYCENCAVKARIPPAAKALCDEMRRADFDEIVQFIPGGAGFWDFLKNMAENGTCSSCRDGGGNPGCAVRVCAREKGVDLCALCADYPCKHFAAFFAGYPILERDNALLCDEGWAEWAKLQDERRASGFTYSDAKQE